MTTKFYAGAADDGSLFIEVTRPDGTEIGFFLEDWQLPKTAAEVQRNRQIPVHRLTIRGAEQLADLLMAGSIDA